MNTELSEVLRAEVGNSCCFQCAQRYSTGFSSGAYAGRNSSQRRPRCSRTNSHTARLRWPGKGSSNLTEDAAVDVRKETAAAAGVSVGNVTKVKQLVGVGHPELLEALRGSEVSIHRAWKWSTGSPDQQIEGTEDLSSRERP